MDEPLLAGAIEAWVAPIRYLESLSNSGGKIPKQSALYVCVTAGGVQGWGEAPCLDARGYSQDDLENALGSLRSDLGSKAEWLDLRANKGALHQIPMRSGAARVALEAAICSVLATLAGTTLISYLGQELSAKECGRETSDCLGIGIAVPYDLPPKELSSRLVRAEAEGVSRVKIKVSPMTISNVVAVLKERSFSGEVLLDANGSFTRDRPLPASRLGEVHIRAVEQPYALGANDLTEEASEFVDVLYDESAISTMWVQRQVLEAKSTRLGVVVKPFRLGSIFATAALARELVAGARPFYFGGMYESSLGKLILAGLHCALEAPLVSDLSLGVSDDPFEALYLERATQGGACLRARGLPAVPVYPSKFMHESHKVFSWARGGS